MKLIPDFLKGEIALRINRIKEKMAAEELEAVFIASNTNVYYSTGRFFRGYVYVSLSHDPIWFVVRPATFQEEENVIYIRKPEDIPAILENLNLPMPKTIGFEFKSMPYSDIMRFHKVFGPSEMKDCSPLLSGARMIKTDYEINEMRSDGVHQAEAYRKVPKCYKRGMTDLELQIEIERILRLEGCLGVVRTAGNLMEINLGSVIVGENADVTGPYEFTMGGAGVDPSHPVGANGSEIKCGESVMIDMNGTFNGYQTDMTRVWRLGELPELAYKCHECSIRILRTLEKMGVPGVRVADLYDEAEKIVKENGLEEWFMGHNYHVSFIGHGVGIELNEPPVVMKKSRDILQANMTIALEPKFVIPHVGAVGVENTYVVTPSGLESITSFPEEIMEL